MSSTLQLTVDGNEAVARVAHRINEVIAIYPITPASPMGEHADAWSAQGTTNLWGDVPRIIEMQSEAGAAGAVHGALQCGTLTTTFTASQGLLLMIPNLYKIAGELSPMVIHVAARSVAAQALSIFCDHSDVMATRMTGFALLAANSVQEAHDMALLSQAAALRSRIPVIHFFDGFRTSHEVAKIDVLPDDVLRAMIQQQDIDALRSRALDSDAPVVRGTAQNPDVFFQARETVNPYYQAFPDILGACFDEFAALTGRRYQPYEYLGVQDAEQVIVLMGSGAETAEETVLALNQQGYRVGMIKVRLYRPFSAAHLLSIMPESVRAVAVLDRTKEPGSEGEPLYKDIVSAMYDAVSSGSWQAALPRICGGRYGLSSKEFTPGMVKAVYDALAAQSPPRQFTIGIDDDVTCMSLPWNRDFRTHANKNGVACVFFGLGSDGTVSANKNSIKIIGESSDRYAQGYFVYDSKKSGAVTISHLRFGHQPIHSAYLIEPGDAQFVACHQPGFLDKHDMLSLAAPGAVFLLNSPEPAATVWDSLPGQVQQAMLAKQLSFYVIDAYRVAQENGLGRRINTIMQTCFFAISNVLPKDAAIAAIKAAVEHTYGRKGSHWVRQNFAAIDATLQALHQVLLPAAEAVAELPVPASADLPLEAGFVAQVTRRLIAGEGDRIPVSQLPCDGTFPTGTAALEKRNLALEIPQWETDLCTHCGKCVFVCPHSAIRSKAYPESELVDAPDNFRHVAIKGKDYPAGIQISYQVAPEDCTGCSLCVDICPIRDKAQASRKALNMVQQPPLLAQEKQNWAFFERLPDLERTEAKLTTMKGAMLLEPLFEFSGACSGCGETPYIRLATQLFGDRMIVANATGCSSIYGGNLPTTPWTRNAEGRGPAWSNSLFEDNAEFGLGMRVAWDYRRRMAERLLTALAPQWGSDAATAILQADQSDEPGLYAQRERVKALKQWLSRRDEPEAAALLPLADALCKRSVWIIGGDGWAYDIGFGGLDHVLASGEDVNILVLDTEVYSNTGGQTSKATPRAAVAKFSAGGKDTAKKDLARIAMTYDHVYVAHVAYGAKDVHTLHTFLEAESYPGPSLIIAYAPCIAHGVDLSNNHRQQNLAVDTGHWPLFRRDPRRMQTGHNPFRLDSKAPARDYADFVRSETRFSMLSRLDPERAELLLNQAREEVKQRYTYYEQLALEPSATASDSEKG